MPSRKSKILVAAFAVALVAAISIPSIALAGPGRRGHGPGAPHGGPGGHGMHFKMIAEHLDLTDDQKAQIHELMAQRREAAPDKRDEMRDAHRALAELIFADQFDEAAVRAAAAVITAAHTERIVEHAQLFQQIRQILTPEQLEQFQELRERQEELGGMHGEGFGGPGRGHRGPHGFGGDCPFDTE